jgi:predicted ATP-grasp superfamily ATP-dependent carboligase
VRVLVTDGGNRNALAAVRALGRRGFEVWAGHRSRRAQSFYSRYCTRSFQYPAPSGDYDRFIEFMLAFLRRRPCDVLLPASDYSTLFASTHREELAPLIRLAVPDAGALSIAMDKTRTLEVAQNLGIEIPLTHCPREVDELHRLSHSIEYPCVLKPRRGAGAAGIRYPNSPAELLALHTMVAGTKDPTYDPSFPMIQEYIPGEIHDVCALFNEGKAVASLTQRRLKMFPVTGGAGVLNETTDEPGLRDRALALLEKLGWHGPAQVEFKIDARDETPKLMEVNGRFWGTLGLAIEAGVDFPYLTCLIASGRKVQTHPGYRVGLQHKWIVPDGLMYIASCRNRFRAFREFFDLRGDSRSEICLSDPLPFFHESFLYAAKSIVALSRRALAGSNKPEDS